MDCSRASNYMMKYMDGNITADEASKLKKHIDKCNSCKEDFEIYDIIMEEFSEVEICEAPADLEDRVMQEISKLTPISEKINNNADRLIWTAMGIFAMVMGLAFAIFLKKDDIMAYLSSSSQLAGYVNMLSPVSEFVTSFTSNIEEIMTSTIASVTLFVGAYKFVILIAATILLAVQIAIYRKEKVEG